MKSFITFVAGFAGGWAARSLADSPHGVGVKLIEVGTKAKDKVEKWAASEYERLSDMFAEAESRAAAQESKSSHLKSVH